VLRLLPETMSGGLFPDRCWLGSTTLSGEVQCSPLGRDAATMQGVLQNMLASLPAPEGRRRLRLRLLVSDALAAVCMLPWQEQLERPAELRAYARACFERYGLTVDDKWAMFCGFRQFRHGGIAYALPRAWLELVEASCVAHQVRLQTVLPVSAAAYWQTPPCSRMRPQWLILSEGQRLTGFIYQNGGLAHIDVQPVTGDETVAGVRLLQRMAARYPVAAQLRYWSPSAPPAAPPPSYLEEQLPDADVVHITRDAWSR